MIPPRRAAPEDFSAVGAAGGRAAAALVSASAPAGRRRRPTSRASSASLTVELDVGQELREIADSLPLSRSVSKALSSGLILGWDRYQVLIISHMSRTGCYRRGGRIYCSTCLIIPNTRGSFCS